MKGFLKRKGTWLAGAAIALALCASAGTAMAYFTDSTAAAGGIQIDLKGSTEVTESKVESWTKYIQVNNTGNTDVYVRVAVFAGDKYTLTQVDSPDWTLNEADGYYYYNGVLPAQTDTSELLIQIGGMDEEDGDFSVVVAQECVPVTYVNGEAQAADWSLAVPPQNEEG